MSSDRGGFSGVAIVFLLAVIGLIALLTVTAAAPAAAGAPLPTGASGIPAVFGGPVTGHNLVLGTEVPLRAMPPIHFVPHAAPLPGPQPMDAPFAPNVAIWTDPNAQTAPASAVDSQGRIYVAFEHAVSATNHDIYVTWSDDGGTTWITPMALVQRPGNDGNATIAITNNDQVNIFYDSNEDATSFWYVWSADRGASWTIQQIQFTPGSFQDLRLPAMVPGAGGAGVYGAYQIWCIAPACVVAPATGSNSVLVLRNQDITSTTGWRGIYFAQTPDLELFHPAAGYLSGDIELFAAEMEITDNVNYDITWGRIDFTAGSFLQDGFICGTTCPSDIHIFPSLSEQGNNAILGGMYLNAAVIGPNTVSFAIWTNNVPGGLSAWHPTHDTSGANFRVDAAAADQKWLKFYLDGTQVVAGYWKAGATAYATSYNYGNTFRAPDRVSDNTPATTIDSVHAVTIVNTTGGPILAWQDSRDGNPNIYTTGLQKFPVTIATTPRTDLQVRLDGAAFTAPHTANLVSGTSHTIEGVSPQSPTPNTQYVFVSWNDGSTVNPRTITVSAAITYTATFQLQYQTTIATVPLGRSINVDGAPQVGDYQFWCNATSQHAITVPSPQLTSPTSRYVYQSWSDAGAQNHTITCDAPKTVTVTFGLEYLVTLATNPNGLSIQVGAVNYADGTTLWWAAGQTISLFAGSPQAGALTGTQYIFVDWQGGPPIQAWGPAVTGPTTFTANFQLQYQITFDTNPAALQVIVRGTTRTAPWPEWCTSGDTVTGNAITPQAGGTGTQYTFSAWSDGTPGVTNTVTCDGVKTVTAVYTTQYWLTTAVTSGGAVSPTSNWFNKDAIVPLSTTAPPRVGATDQWGFGNWSGDYVGYDPSSASVTMTGPKTVRANWVHQWKTDIDATTSVQIKIDGVDTTVPVTRWWNETSTHILVAPLSRLIGQDTQYGFVSWTGGGSNATLQVTVSGAASYVANYNEQFRVTVAITPADASVTLDGTAYTGVMWFDNNHNISLVAPSPQPTGTAGKRYVFSAWGGDASGGATTFVRVTSPKSITVTFTTQYQLTVVSPYGGPVCTGGTAVDNTHCWYDDGSSATVTVTSPFTASDGNKYVITGWDSGSGTTTLTVPMGAPVTVTASWRQVTFLEEFGVYLGLIIAIIVVLVILLLVLVMRRRKKAKEEAAPAEEEAETPPPPAK